MANKNDVTRIPLDGLLNLNKYRSDIKQFEGFNKKNSPIYGGVLSPLYEEKQTINENEKTVLVNDDKYSLIKENDNGSYLYKNGEFIQPYANVNLTKESIKVPYNILAFERDEENPNYIDMFVEGARFYEIKRYNINTSEFEDMTPSYIPIGKISKVEMRYGFVVFYNFDLKQIIILRKGKSEYRRYEWAWIVEKNLVDKLTFTINKLKSTFNHEGQSRYILSYYGLQFDDNNSIKTGNGNRILTLDDSIQGFTSTRVTLKSTTDNSLDYYRIPTFAIYSTEEDVTFYNVFIGDMNDHNGLYYLSGTADSYDETNKILYVNCKNSITLNNSIPSKANNRTASLEANTYFYSILLKTNVSAMENGNKCLNHHVLFDSTRNYFIGNCGYIPNNNGTQSVPYGFRVKASTCADRLLDFAYLINYGNITNISARYDDKGMGNTLAEWNFIDNDVIPKAYDTCCLYKISNENTINLIQVKKEMPDMEVLFNRYIVVKTHEKNTIIDTSTTSFYHGFVDYNNRVIPCEKYGDTSIANFPFGASDTKPYLNATLTDYLYASAVNANMEISKNNLSSIQYNPSVINQGCHYNYNIEKSSYGSSSLQDYVSVYLSDDKRALVPIYYSSFIKEQKYVDESLRDIPYPVTTNGNILYSANLFSEIINSYSNRDMIINDTVAYPLLYINNQPSFSFYFLNGIEGVNSAFILHGMNYVNTDDFIFSVTYNGDIISNTEAIVSIKGFRFLGNTTEVGFFYSELMKSVYAFYGDRTLKKVYDCTEIKNIKHTFFNPINYNIYITTDDYIYVIDDNTVYRIEISGVKNMNFSDRFIYVYTEDNLYILSYEKPSESYLFNTLNSFKKIPIKLETQLYGVGNNIKSVIDCIYLRLFNDNIVEQGTLKLSVKTLTDKGESTEEKAFTINASDWDKESNTFYIRYQPKNQECIGMSVNIVSDFAIADFDIGYSTDETIQVSKYNA